MHQLSLYGHPFLLSVAIDSTLLARKYLVNICGIDNESYFEFYTELQKLS